MISIFLKHPVYSQRKDSKEEESDPISATYLCNYY